MSGEIFLRSPVLDALGVDHGLGTALSAGVTREGLVCLKQVHGTRTVEVPPLPEDPRADALWTRKAGLAVGVYTADCVPILLVDTGRRAVAAIHAGWRGSAAGISENAATAVIRCLDAPASDLIAVIGPHIGSCCYEVDDPVRQAVDVDSVFSPAPRPGHFMLDLLALNRIQLERAGLQPDRIHRVDGCTFCDARFASFRRDGTGGRMLHFVRMPGT